MKNKLTDEVLLLALLATRRVAVTDVSHDAEAMTTGIRDMQRRGVRTIVLNIGSEAA